MQVDQAQLHQTCSSLQSDGSASVGKPEWREAIHINNVPILNTRIRRHTSCGHRQNRVFRHSFRSLTKFGETRCASSTLVTRLLFDTQVCLFVPRQGSFVGCQIRIVSYEETAELAKKQQLSKGAVGVSFKDPTVSRAALYTRDKPQGLAPHLRGKTLVTCCTRG